VEKNNTPSSHFQQHSHLIFNRFSNSLIFQKTFSGNLSQQELKIKAEMRKQASG